VPNCYNTYSMTLDSSDKKSRSKHLYSLCVNPEVSFEGQTKSERVILLLRAHPITFVPWIIVASLMFLLPFILNVFLFSLFRFKEVIFINIFWYSATFSYVLVNIISWLFNVGIVTNERIIDIDYQYLLYKEISASTLEDAVDVTAKTSGFIHTFLHYGDIYVQTAGNIQNIEFYKTPDPSDVVSVINQLMQQHEDRRASL